MVRFSTKLPLHRFMVNVTEGILDSSYLHNFRTSKDVRRSLLDQIRHSSCTTFCFTQWPTRCFREAVQAMHEDVWPFAPPPNPTLRNIQPLDTEVLSSHHHGSNYRRTLSPFSFQMAFKKPTISVAINSTSLCTKLLSLHYMFTYSTSLYLLTIDTVDISIYLHSCI